MVSGQLLCAYNIQLWCPCPSLANLSKAELTKPKSEGCPDPRQLQRFLKIFPCQSTATGELQRARPWGFRERWGWGPCPQIRSPPGEGTAVLRLQHHKEPLTGGPCESNRTRKRPVSAREAEAAPHRGPLELRLRCWQWEEDGGTSSGEITSAQAQRCEKGCSEREKF